MTEKNNQNNSQVLFESYRAEKKQWQEHETDFVLSSTHKCEYLENTNAMTLFLNPMGGMDSDIYEHLLENGFRRSGEHVYRPHCPSCNGCISVRIPIETFSMSRNMKRIWKRNNDLEVNSLPPVHSHEHFNLYQNYVSSRHKGGPMDNHDPYGYMDFLFSSWMETGFYEFRRAEKLYMVAVVDHLKQGLSAVYTFFDHSEHSRSLGTFAVLWEIEHARRLGKQWLYLGYWISNCRKMSYKSRFRPLEIFREGCWQLLDGDKL